MILLPKCKGGYRGIGLVEVLWEVRLVVVNFCLKRSAVLHSNLRGFREGRGASTATLEAKLANNLSGITHKPLFQVFLDLYKACDSLNRRRCL